MHSILGRGSFSTNSSISEVWHGSNKPVALLRHYWAFSSSGLLDWPFLIFLLKISHRFHMGFRSGMLASQSSTVISLSAKHLEVVLALWAGAKVLLGKEISISIKLVSRWKHEVLWPVYQEMLEHLIKWLDLTLDLIKHNGPTPAYATAPQIITDCGNFTLDFRQHGFCASPVFLQTPDLDFQMKCKMYLYLKRGLWTTEQQSSSFSP